MNPQTPQQSADDDGGVTNNIVGGSLSVGDISISVVVRPTPGSGADASNHHNHRQSNQQHIQPNYSEQSCDIASGSDDESRTITNTDDGHNCDSVLTSSSIAYDENDDAMQADGDFAAVDANPSGVTSDASAMLGSIRPAANEVFYDFEYADVDDDDDDTDNVDVDVDGEDMRASAESGPPTASNNSSRGNNNNTSNDRVLTLLNGPSALPVAPSVLSSIMSDALSASNGQASAESVESLRQSEYSAKWMILALSFLSHPETNSHSAS